MLKNLTTKNLFKKTEIDHIQIFHRRVFPLVNLVANPSILCPRTFVSKIIRSTGSNANRFIIQLDLI